MKKERFAILAAFCAACLFGACSDDKDDKPSEPEKPKIVENTSALCSDGLDNDENGAVDCDDPGCAGLLYCQNQDPSKENSPRYCNDGVDNDSDGKFDCEDSECKQFTMCQASVPENNAAACNDGKDNDKDSLIDCKDPDCAQFCGSVNPGGDPQGGGEKVVTEKENTAKACRDGKDNDGDGDVDCADSECLAIPGVCASELVKESTRELCSDGIDNDLNGKTDCADKNCRNLDVCTSGGSAGENTYESCQDNLDNDGDGKNDCADPECQYFDICQPGWTNSDNDKYKDDPYKFQEDACGSGKTKTSDGACYENIGSATEFVEKISANQDGKYILKRPIDFGDTDQDPLIFSGTLDGNNMRISGFLTQNPSGVSGTGDMDADEYAYKCGLFKGPSGATLMNINLAITLNCTVSQNMDKVPAVIYMGALVTNGGPTLQNITGESKVMLRTIQDSDLYPKSKYQIYVGGLIGLHAGGVMKNIDIAGNASVQFDWKFEDPTTEYSDKRNIYLGGVVGKSELNTIEDVNTSSIVSLDYAVNNPNYKDNAIYMGGIAGDAVELSNCHNIDGAIYIKHGNAGNGYYDHYFGGVVGLAHRVSNSTFTGTLTSSGTEGIAKASAKIADNDDYVGTNIGGIAGGLLKHNGSKKEMALDGCYVDASMSLIAADGMYAGGLLGRMGLPQKDDNSDKYFIYNCYSNVDLALHGSGAFYWGGAVSQGAMNGYVLNSYLRSDYIADAFTIADTTDVHLGGIVSKYAAYQLNTTNGSYTNISKPDYGGKLINNFVSGGPVTLSDMSANVGLLAATNGYYIYETYWNGDVYGRDINAATQSTKQDGSARPYRYNVQGIPILSDNQSVLSMLRKNSGHDGGVKSTYLPTGLVYSDWKDASDEDGNRVPVPAI